MLRSGEVLNPTKIRAHMCVRRSNTLAVHSYLREDGVGSVLLGTSAFQQILLLLMTV